MTSEHGTLRDPTLKVGVNEMLRKPLKWLQFTRAPLSPDLKVGVNETLRISNITVAENES